MFRRYSLYQCFSNAGPRPGTGINYTGPREVLLEIVILVFYEFFHEQILYNGYILKRNIFVNVSKNSAPDVGLRKLKYATRFH